MFYMLLGKIYVLGGITERNRSLSSIECYDPVMESWSAIDKLKSNRFGHKVVAAKGIGISCKQKEWQKSCSLITYLIGKVTLNRCTLNLKSKSENNQTLPLQLKEPTIEQKSSDTLSFW